jgi:hypothetical protein
MQPEELDKKIIEAAENHHPVYNEKAWIQMESLLDKHLPQESNKRRRFLLWWLLPVLLSGTVLLVTQIRKDKKQITAVTNKETGTTVGEKNNSIPADKAIDGLADTRIISADSAGSLTGPVKNTRTGGDPITSPAGVTINVPVAPDKVNEKKKIDISTPSQKNNYSSIVSGKGVVKTEKMNQRLPDKKKIAENKERTNTKVADTNPLFEIVSGNSKKKSDQQQKPDEQAGVIAEREKSKSDGPLIEKIAAAKLEKIKDPAKTDTVSQLTEKETAVSRLSTKKKKKGSFFFSLSAGPDMSFVGSNKAGTVKIVAGAGIGYTYKDKFTLRTGFYSGRKIYSASADSYHPPASFSQFYPYLEKVDANCRIYEIPVSLAYSFGKKPSGSWFVSAGLSSFLMNEETYNYHYKYTPSGNTYTKKWTIKNENYNLFSVATLSTGYKRSIGKRATFMAEPYIKVPFGGVGYGKVKLNSGGVLFTVGIKAF